MQQAAKKSNPKAKGEIGELIVLGALGKIIKECQNENELRIFLPYSDNSAVDVILEIDGRLVRAQIKSSNSKQNQNSIMFDLTSNNWYSKTIKKYTTDDVDIFLLCDYDRVFLLGPKDFVNRASFTIRYEPAKTNQTKNVHFADDYELTANRLRALLELPIPAYAIGRR